MILGVKLETALVRVRGPHDCKVCAEQETAKNAAIRCSARHEERPDLQTK